MKKNTNYEISEIILSYFCILLYLVRSFIQFCIYLCTSSHATSFKYYSCRNKVYSFIQKVNHSISKPTLTFKAHANGRNKPQQWSVMLANNVASVCGLEVWTVSNYTQQVPTSANIVLVPCKRTENVGPNNIACCWPPPNNVASICMGLQ